MSLANDSAKLVFVLGGLVYAFCAALSDVAHTIYRVAVTPGL